MFNRKRRPKLKDQIADLKEKVKSLESDLKWERSRAVLAEKKLEEIMGKEIFDELEKRSKEWENTRGDFEDTIKAAREFAEKTKREYKNPKENWTEPPGPKQETEKERQQREQGFYYEETADGVKFHYKKEPFKKKDPFFGEYEFYNKRKRQEQRQEQHRTQTPYTSPGSPFKTLNLTPMATKTQIKSKYHELAKKWHPDKEGGDAQKFNKITRAYQDCLKMVI